jgi:pimeloyl-ACP methyl ester carboxylesterase
MQTKPLQVPEGFVSTFTQVSGHQIHALEGGNKDLPKIVLLHGALASRRYLMPTAVLLAKSMHVFVPEMPGHGASSKPKHALAVEQQADVLFEWLNFKELKQTHLFANSYGCQVAAQLAASYPDALTSLMLADPTVDPQARSRIQQLYRLYLDGFLEPKNSKAQLLADLWDMGPIITLETGQRMIEDDIRPKLAKIKCPTLVLRGENDPIAPEKWTEEVTQRIPNAKMVVIPKAPHSINYATPAQLTKIILDFIG